MDIETDLRQLLALHDPGVRFTDGVISRLGDVPDVEPSDGVALIADARARKRSRRVLIATAVTVAIAAAAAIPTLMLRGQTVPAVVAEASPQPAGDLAPEPPPESAVTAGSQSEAPDRAPDPFDCLDPDVIHGLLLQAWSNPRFSTKGDLPSELTGFEAPGKFTLVGTTERAPAGSPEQSTVSVVYRTGLTPEAARAAGGQALAAGGWSSHPGRLPSMPEVFRAGNARPYAETWCREGRPIALGSSAVDGVTYVIFSASRSSGSDAGIMNACSQPAHPARVESALDQLMPRLELPRDPATGTQVPVSGGGGGGNGETERRANTSFTVRDSVGSVAQHFGRQMAEQGWSGEASWAGSETAGSTWTRPMESGAVLRGILMVSAFSGDRFTAVLHVVQTK